MSRISVLMYGDDMHRLKEVAYRSISQLRTTDAKQKKKYKFLVKFPCNIFMTSKFLSLKSSTLVAVGTFVLFLCFSLVSLVFLFCLVHLSLFRLFS